MDYSVDSTLDFTVAGGAGEEFCVDLSTMDDTLAEPTEQFELYFEPINPAGSATVGNPATVCVNIEDNDGMQAIAFLCT